MSPKATGKPKTTKKPPESRLAVRRDGRRKATLRKSDQKMDEILTAAAHVFRRLGYAQSTLEDVAAEVGMNRASLYYYVATKSELLTEVLRQPAFDMTAALSEIHESEVTPAKKITEAIAAHMRALDSNYPGFFVFLAENLYLQTAGDPAGDVVQNARRYGNLFAEIIEEGQASGDFRDDVDPRIAMLGIVGMCNWTHRWYREGDGMSLPEIGDQFVALVVGGLLVQRRRARK
jgi:TetR/AcrR family transcriptional regulator, cholesterol catabolism regulator